MVRTLVLDVTDDPDVLTRVALACRRRRFPIESVTIGKTEDAGRRRVTLSVEADAGAARRLAANLEKLVDVRHVEDVTDRPVVVRDLAMIKVTAPPEARADIMQLVQVFRARVVDVAADSLVIETTGTEDKVDGLLQVLRPFGVKEMVRTGRVAMCRGAQAVVASPASGADPTAGDAG
jgi:acetolactate synthase-1/3 small subunit